MIDLLSVGDVHLSDIAPVGRRDDYAMSIMAKLVEIVDIANRMKAKIVFVGDIFHRVRFNDYRVMSALIKLLKTADCYAIYGNHDWNPRTQDIKGQPISVLFSSGAVSRLNPEGIVLSDGEGCRVELKGIDYKRELDLKQVRELQWNKEVQAKVLVLHAMIVPTGSSFYGEYYPVDKVETEADVVCIGHPHWDQGEVRHGRTAFINFGATSRLYPSESNRTVQVGHIHIDGSKIEINPIPLVNVKPVADVFIERVGVVKGTEKPMLAEQIVSAMGSQETMDLSNLPIPDEHKQIVDHYLTMAKLEKS